MQIQTALFGDLTIKDTDIITFPDAIPGFSGEHEFVLIPLDDDSPFFYFQSVKTKELCLIITDPFTFFTDYEIKLDEESIQKLEIIEGKTNIALYSILTIPEEFKKTTANLLAPIVINADKKIGLQFIAQNYDYNTKHFIFPQNQSEEIKPATRKGL
ncbi:MAG TPA: flagellar assembly protein FliW [Syntrophomonadaceae bacterium]|nr:flagellar assembly protein FliW [Syntrophomonadaceae bacterium]